MEKKYDIIKLEERHYKKVSFLLNEVFGENYMDEEELKEYSKSGIICYVVEHEGNVLGAHLLLMEGRQEIKQELSISDEELDKMGFGKKLCHLKSIGVHQSIFNEEKLKEKLYDIAYEKALDLGVETFWCTAWKINEKIPMNDRLVKKGFTRGRDYPLVWFENKKYKCKECKGPCRCTGVLYYKNILLNK